MSEPSTASKKHCNDLEILRLLLTHFDQQCLGVVLKYADSRVVCSILDAWKCGLPGGHTWTEEHGADGSPCRDTGFIQDLIISSQ